jgi:hypothetical protein
MARTLVGNLGETVSKTTDYFTNIPKITAPYTTIVNRAQVTDFAADGLPKFGIDRLATQHAQEVFGETGPNGERVFKAVNDIHDAIRFVGNWSNNNDTAGQRIISDSQTTNFIEVTFYGTGINILHVLGFSYDIRVTVDGGTESANIIPTASQVLVNPGRNYSTNQAITAASNLTLGFHTVKFRQGNSTGLTVYGFEVINTSSSIFVPVAESFNGSSRLYSSSTSTTAYNSGFESGTLGTRGGHVLVYQKTDGTIAKAVTPTNTSSAILTSVDHTNEELVRSYNPREFSAGRADDFSSATVGGDQQLAFTLDDGTTTLVANGAYFLSTAIGFLGNNTVGRFHTLTFVGTGLDILYYGLNTTGTQSWSVSVDGASAVSQDVTGVNGAQRLFKICSGLPYGTHTVKITTTANPAGAQMFGRYDVYAPKTPTLPTGAIALADYFVMADFAANTTAGIDYIATGVLRKVPTREFTYVNGTGGTGDWSVGLSATAYPAGWTVNTDRQNAYFEYTFFGTGFEHRFGGGSNRSANIQVSLQSLSTGGSLQNLTSTNFPSISTSTYGTGASFNATTGIYDQQDAAGPSGSGLRISGLPLALYKVRFLNNTASSFIINDALDIITPIHAPKDVGPARLQNVSMTGSCGVRDLRKFSELQVGEQKKWCQAVGVNNNQSTTVGTLVPVTDSAVSLKVTKAGRYLIAYNCMSYNDTANAGTATQLVINSQTIGSDRATYSSVANIQTMSNDQYVVELQPGNYTIQLYFLRNGGATGVMYALRRTLTVSEL